MSTRFDRSKQTIYDRFDSKTSIMLTCETISKLLPVYFLKKFKHYFKLILAIKTISIDISSVIEQIHKKYFNRTVVSILKIPKNEKYH